MNRPPAFQFYPKDWLDFRVQRMSLAAQGAYLKILCFMWADSQDQCSILDDNALIARGLGTAVEQWLELRQEIQCESDPIFEQKSSYLVSARLRHEATKQRKYRKAQSEKGKRSAQHRLNHGSTRAEPKHQPEGDSSSSLKELKREGACSALTNNPRSSTPSNPKKKPVLVPLPDGFTISNDLWAWTAKKGYPRELVEREFDTFCNDRLSKGVQYADWDRAFMTWLGRQGEFIHPRRNGRVPPSAQRRKEPLPL